MKRTLTLFVNEFDNLVFGWKVGRNQYFLESDWTYSCSGKGMGIDLQEELKQEYKSLMTNSSEQMQGVIEND